MCKKLASLPVAFMVVATHGGGNFSPAPSSLNIMACFMGDFHRRYMFRV